MKMLNIKDSEIYYEKIFIHKDEATNLFDRVFKEAAWKSRKIKIFGKEVLEPRLSAWYGDSGTRYKYSGITLKAKEWIPSLTMLRKKVEQISKTSFNSVLLNLYRDGNDSMGLHSDDEKELGQNPIIASVSLGTTRLFKLRHKKDKETTPKEIELHHGSLLLMKGETQHFWKHEIPKSKKCNLPRINLTFRNILPS